MANVPVVSSVADRRGLIHFLRSSHSSVSETTSRSRRTSRSVTSESRHSVDLLIEERDQTQNVEHRRVIDSFVVGSSLQRARDVDGHSRSPRTFSLKSVFD